MARYIDTSCWRIMGLPVSPRPRRTAGKCQRLGCGTTLRDIVLLSRTAAAASITHAAAYGVYGAIAWWSTRSLLEQQLGCFAKILSTATAA